MTETFAVAIRFTSHSNIFDFGVTKESLDIFFNAPKIKISHKSDKRWTGRKFNLRLLHLFLYVSLLVVERWNLLK